MDFFDRQERARRNTTLLVFYFVVAVVLIVLAVYAAIAAWAYYGGFKHHLGNSKAFALWHPKLFLWSALGTLSVILGGCAWRVSELSRGGSSVASMLGGKPVNPQTTNPDERKLLNVVEEMALASGTPVPLVYLLPDASINAFAAGFSTRDVVIAVTRGAVQVLSRDELQGVIGHEFSHILNGDMRLNLRLIGFIFGIMGIALVGRILLRTRGRKNPLPLLGLALLLVGWIGVFFARLIQSAVSRQREFLADASAVQFTRNPDGLAGALKKIGGLRTGSEIAAPRAPEASHLFFANGLKTSFFSLFTTHPPLTDRIRAIQPDWNGEFPVVDAPVPDPGSGSARKAASPRKAPRFPGQIFPVPWPATSQFVTPTIGAETVLPSVGEPQLEHLRYAESFRAALPASIEAAVRDPLGASAVIYALLFSPDEPARQKQLTEFSDLVPEVVRDETVRLLTEVSAAAARAKLPLVDLALPALHGLSPDQFEQFEAAIKVLIESDAEIDWFEYVLQKIVRRHLEPQYRKTRRPVVQYYALRPLVPDCAFLLSVLARVGQDDAVLADAAFRFGWQSLHAPEFDARILPIAECTQDQLDAALDRLAQASPLLKKNLLNACAMTVAADRRIQEQEAELLRAIADTLDCPIPPFVEGVAAEPDAAGKSASGDQPASRTSASRATRSRSSRCRRL